MKDCKQGIVTSCSNITVAQAQEKNKVNQEKIKNMAKEITEKDKFVNNLNKNYEAINKNFKDLLGKMEQGITSAAKKDIVKVVNEIRFETIESTLQTTITNLNNQLAEERVRNLQHVQDKEKLKGIIKELEEKTKVVEKEPEKIVEEEFAVEKEEVILDKKFFGFVNIIGNDHWLIYPNKEKESVKLDLKPGDFYINKQSVIVDDDNSIIKRLNYCIDKDINSLEIVIIEQLNGKLLAMDANGKVIREIIKDNRNINIDLSGKVAGIQGNRIKMMFKHHVEDAESLAQSLTAKECSVYIVVSYMSESYICRDFFTGELTIIPEKSCKITPKVSGAIIADKNMNIVKVMEDSSFYACCRRYDKREYAVAKRKGDGFSVITASGKEISISNEKYLIDFIYDGDVIALDEFNNVLFIANSDKTIKKLIRKRKISKSIDNNEKIVIKDKVYIIGNINFKTSYSLAFMKEGIEAVVLDGYSNFPAIKRALKEANNIIVVTSYTSHDNMWRIKETFSKDNVKLYHAKQDGANALLNEYLSI